MNDILAMVPFLRRAVHLRRLFDWLDEALKTSRNSTVNGYPELPGLLLESLEGMGDEIASVSLLKYCQKLRALNEKIRATELDGDISAFELQLDELPRVEEQYQVVRRDCRRTVIAWLVIPALIALAIALRSCCAWPL